MLRVLPLGLQLSWHVTALLSICGDEMSSLSGLDSGFPFLLNLAF